MPAQDHMPGVLHLDLAGIEADIKLSISALSSYPSSTSPLPSSMSKTGPPPPKARTSDVLPSAPVAPSKRRKLTHPSKPPKPSTKTTTTSPSKPPGTKRITVLPHPPRPKRQLPRPPSPVPAVLSSNTAAATSDSAASKAQARLAALANLFDLLAQLLARNRNQHRAQPWFKHASILAKWLRRLYGVEREVWGLRYGDAAVAGSKNGARDGGGGGGGGAAEQVRRSFEREAELGVEKGEVEGWVREQVVPELWARATGLVGDGQFAGVGLVLVGLVAEARGLVGGTRVRVVEEDGKGVVGVGAYAREAGQRKPRVEEAASEDVGEVIERQGVSSTIGHLRNRVEKGDVSVEQQLVSDDDLDMPMNGAEEQSVPRASSPFASFEDDMDQEDDQIVPLETKLQPTARPSTHNSSPLASHTAASKPGPYQHSSRVSLLQPSENLRTAHEEGHGLDTQNRSSKEQGRRGDKAEMKKAAGMGVQGSESISGFTSEDTTKSKLKSKSKKHQKETLEAKGKNKSESKSKTKSKAKAKANAIDDLFSGFG